MTKATALKPKVKRLFGVVGIVVCLFALEQAALAVAPTTRLDFDGDGKTGFAVFRPSGTGSGSLTFTALPNTTGGFRTGWFDFQTPTRQSSTHVQQGYQ